MALAGSRIRRTLRFWMILLLFLFFSGIFFFFPKKGPLGSGTGQARALSDVAKCQKWPLVLKALGALESSPLLEQEKESGSWFWDEEVEHDCAFPLFRLGGIIF